MKLANEYERGKELLHVKIRKLETQLKDDLEYEKSRNLDEIDSLKHKIHILKKEVGSRADTMSKQSALQKELDACNRDLLKFQDESERYERMSRKLEARLKESQNKADSLRAALERAESFLLSNSDYQKVKVSFKLTLLRRVISSNFQKGLGYRVTPAGLLGL